MGPTIAALARTAQAGRRFLLPLFGLQFILIDLALRRGRAVHQLLASPGPAFAALHSACLWLALGAVARRSPGRRAAVALAAAFFVAFQCLFFARFARFFDRHVARSAILSWNDVGPAFRAELPRLAAVIVIVTAVQAIWLRGGLVPPAARRHATVAAVVLALLAPLSAALKGPPDLRLIDAAVSLPLDSPAPVAVAAAAIPTLRSPRAALPNVVLVVTESVRADDYCSAPAAACPTAPEVNALLPERIGFSQMRSLASFTVVSLSALVTGRAQNLPRAELLQSPTVFDALKALESPGPRPYTAYWSAHHAPMFPWDDPKRSLDSYVTFDTLFEQPGQSLEADVRLAEMFEQRLATLPSPFFVVLHFHDTHILYRFDEESPPFAPWTRDVRWETMPQLRNAYRNAIHAQDRAIAAAMRALTTDPRWPSTLVLFTSDHGEAFGEHQAIHHGQNLRDEQVHVPGWVAHGRDVLSPAQRGALKAGADGFVTHLDVTPTLLDLYGLWDAPELAPHVAKMPGRSLLRPLREPLRMVPMTNCSETFPCPFNNWGLMQGDHKLEAQGWDSEWSCFKLGGPVETPVSLRNPACEALVTESRTQFPMLPNGYAND